MQEKLVEFANLLRENGVRVSLAETLDAFGAADVTGLSEKEAFRSALRATMVKRYTELPVFEELFELYFSGLGEIIKQASQAVQQALSMSDQEFQKFLEEVEEMLKKEGKKLSELAKQLLQNQSGQMEKKIREAARAVKHEQHRAHHRGELFRPRTRARVGPRQDRAGDQATARGTREDWTSAPK